jgi:glycerophosphoryl diester phosphodiesterase
MSTARKPIIVAHRAGNDLRDLAAAEAAGVDLVEADVWLYQGRLEVRHLKTMGPVPLLWDRWRLAGGWGPRLSLAELLRAAESTTELMLDLKGSARDLPRRVIETVERVAPERRYTVSSQWWGQLEPFRTRPEVRVIHSIGSARMLRALPGWLGTDAAEAVGINQRLLTPARLDALRRLAPLVFTWTVNDRERLDELLEWGVSGVISDDYAALLPAHS